MAQALTDEAFPILLVVQATDLTRQRRRLHDLTVPPVGLVTSMQRHQEQSSERWKKILVQLATAVVSEGMVSEYLSRLSNALDIQPLTRITTDDKYRDGHPGTVASSTGVRAERVQEPVSDTDFDAAIRALF